MTTMSTRTKTRRDNEDEGNDDQGNTTGTTDDPGDKETTKARGQGDEEANEADDTPLPTPTAASPCLQVG